MTAAAKVYEEWLKFWETKSEELIVHKVMSDNTGKYVHSLTLEQDEINWKFCKKYSEKVDMNFTKEVLKKGMLIGQTILGISDDFNLGFYGTQCGTNLQITIFTTSEELYEEIKEEYLGIYIYAE